MERWIKIQFNHKVISKEWDTTKQKWRVGIESNGEKKIYEANFVMACTGYYSYQQAFPVQVPGLDNFKGQVVHPQWWPEDLDVKDKNVVIIGSGATAVTLVPALAENAKKVTQLQRSPSYVVTIPRRETLDQFLHKLMPLSWYGVLLWWKWTALEVLQVALLTTFPNFARKELTKKLKEDIPKDIDPDIHFNPSYNPFEQRLCMCPDGDYFKALHQDNCEIVTDTIDTVDETGIKLNSGNRLDADIIVTATGLYLQILGGVTPIVDGKPMDVGSQYAWRGCMLEGLPNMAFVMGYVKSSWTPGANVMAKTCVRIVKEMEKKNATSVVPVIERKPDMKSELSVQGVNSSYFVKAADRLPKVTGEGPWYGRTNLVKDWWEWCFASMEDGLVYTSSGKGIKQA